VVQALAATTRNIADMFKLPASMRCDFLLLTCNCNCRLFARPNHAARACQFQFLQRARPVLATILPASRCFGNQCRVPAGAAVKLALALPYCKLVECAGSDFCARPLAPREIKADGRARLSSHACAHWTTRARCMGARVAKSFLLFVLMVQACLEFCLNKAIYCIAGYRELCIQTQYGKSLSNPHLP